MPAVDTNVLVRWLIDDDPVQTAHAQKLFDAARTSQSLFVPITVTLELEWVLRSRYLFEKTTVLATYNSLLDTHELEFQDEAAIEHALHRYRSGAAEFADCLHAGLGAVAQRMPLLTFDAKAARLSGVQRVG